jgi:hypothetical protein
VNIRSLVLASILVTGCGGSSAVPRACDRQQTTEAFTQKSCVDHPDVTHSDEAALQDRCTADKGTWLTGPCNHAGAVGGCRHATSANDPTVQIEWWWSGAIGGQVTDAASAERLCGVFVDSSFVAP